MLNINQFILDIGDLNKHDPPKNLQWTLMQGYVQQLPDYLHVFVHNLLFAKFSLVEI